MTVSNWALIPWMYRHVPHVSAPLRSPFVIEVPCLFARRKREFACHHDLQVISADALVKRTSVAQGIQRRDQYYVAAAVFSITSLILSLNPIGVNGFTM